MARVFCAMTLFASCISFDVPTGVPCSETGRCPLSQACVEGVCGNGSTRESKMPTVVHATGKCTWTIAKQYDQHVGALWGGSKADIWALGAFNEVHYTGTWPAQADDWSFQPMNAIWGTGPSDIWAVGDAGFHVHFDGREWSLWGGAGEPRFEGVWGSAPGHYFAVGVSQTGSGGVMYDLTGEGDWSELFVPSIVDSPLHAVWGSAADDVWVVGERGRVVRGKPGAWSAVATATNRSLHTIWGIDKNQVWVGGVDSTVLFWNGDRFLDLNLKNGALSGSEQHDIEAIQGKKGTRGLSLWIVGSGGLVLHYDGKTWQRQESPVQSNISELWVGDEDEAWAATDTGTILYCAR